MQISRGYQICVSCFHESIHLHAHRCAFCDREVCVHCVVRIVESGELLCPDCVLEGAEASETSAKTNSPAKTKGKPE